MDTMETKVNEELNALKDETKELAEVSETVTGKPNYLLIGLATILGIAALYKLIKNLIGKVKVWKAGKEARKAEKEKKRALKDAEKHPENYVSVNPEDIVTDDSDETETE